MRGETVRISWFTYSFIFFSEQTVGWITRYTNKIPRMTSSYVWTRSKFCFKIPDDLVTKHHLEKKQWDKKQVRSSLKGKFICVKIFNQSHSSTWKFSANQIRPSSRILTGLCMTQSGRSVALFLPSNARTAIDLPKHRFCFSRQIAAVSCSCWKRTDM